MCFDFGPLWVKLGSLSFAQLANVQTVGIGLYLALAVIQVVTEGGVAGLWRRTATVEAAIVATKKVDLRQDASGILADIGGLEMGFQKVNGTVLYSVVALFVISVIYFSYCTVWQELPAEVAGTLFILGFYLVLPISIFVVASLYVKSRCSEIDGRIRRLQSDFVAATFGA
ncbi:hypothetical protein IFT67_12495 [Sphingomonas sp. CFBP 13728]|uniref:hypothetical protein n=1 Tax=Sphingomonas sp. CFBP 13728 TaxID=2775294 RepID=UPI001785A8F6|nr:hypothetical protein [Sphingomonas sp. CFBP 13728]MBD8619741.1 hypothetical protein [Sphingomonas sp. CFBP 13728]